MVISFVLLMEFCFLISSLWFGSMMGTIGRLNHWHSRQTFWTSAIIYAVFINVVCFIGINLSESMGGGTDNPYLFLVPGFGILFPIASLVIKRKYPEIFKEAPEYKKETVLKPQAPTENRMRTKYPAAERVKSSPQAVFEQAEKRVEAASEIVYVPKGVTIRVKRSRSVEHTISVNWGVAGEIAGNANLISVVNLTIKSTIERSKATSFQETETIEYEVELNGDTSRGYKLIWIDVWKQGKVELEARNKQHHIPFEYRERSELNVFPVSE